MKCSKIIHLTQFSKDPDDVAWLADHEIGVAPEDPGTYEGDHGKPQQPEDRLNKWCFRECERSISADAATLITVDSLKDWSRRVYNQPGKHLSQPGE